MSMFGLSALDDNRVSVSNGNNYGSALDGINGIGIGEMTSMTSIKVWVA